VTLQDNNHINHLIVTSPSVQKHLIIRRLNWKI